MTKFHICEWCDDYSKTHKTHAHKFLDVISGYELTRWYHDECWETVRKVITP
jgi:hypothetical protein